MRLVDGFRLAYDDHPGDGPAVVALHGRPGDRQDYREVVPRLPGCRVVVPDLRGFGDTEGPAAAEPTEFAAGGQARNIVALIEERGLGPAVLAGYDVGSRVAQEIASSRPDLVRALVLSPPLPGAGTRVLSAGAFVASINWYRSGSAMVARSVAEQPPVQRLATPTVVLWPGHDPLFPRAWSDGVGEFFSDIEVRPLDGVGHFTPLEAPAAFAAAVLAAR